MPPLLAMVGRGRRPLRCTHTYRHELMCGHTVDGCAVPALKRRELPTSTRMHSNSGASSDVRHVHRGGIADPPTDAQAIAVSVRDVSYTYPAGVEALSGFSLEITQGEIVGLVGPSGCGKSTLLSLLAGFERPSKGEIRKTSFESDRHPMAMVFQKDTLLPWLNVADNVRLHYKFRKRSRGGSEESTRSLISMAGLEGFEKAYPYQLSGGMRRRVAFLSAVAAKPQLLLLDEPFSSLDEPTRLGIHQVVLRIIRELGTTAVLVTHDLAEAISLCDQVFIISKRPGRVVSKQRVTFGKDRNVIGLREKPEFLALYAELWNKLSEQLT